MHRLLCAFTMLLPAICSAQLAGQFQYNFNSAPLLWDFSGTYALNNTNGLQVLNYFTNLPNGVITGTGESHLRSFFTDFDAQAVEKGKVVASKTSIRLDVKGVGRDSGSTFAHAFTGPFKERTKGILDPTNRTVVAALTNAACETGGSCQIDGANAVIPLLDMDGTWSLTLNIATSNKVVKGTAALELSNGRTLSFAVRGTQPSALKSATLKLKGTNDTVRTTLSARLDSIGQLQSLKGKLFGQPLVYP